MRLIGTVLWWDARDQNGVIKDLDGRKFYFDVSVLEARTLSKMKSGSVVCFEQNTKITDTLCAHKVAHATAREKARLAKAFEGRRQLSLFQ